MGSNKYRLIQWNCRGIKPRYEELILLLTLLRPSVFCLQETYLKPEDKFTFKTFNTYNHIHSDCLRASGGSSILVNSSLPQREIKLKTDLQAVAVSVAVFFDLEKAYDTTWKYGILRVLHELGVKGRLANFLESFLVERLIQVRVGSTLSYTFRLSQGVPQGSILSTTLFNIKINSIMNCLDPKTDGSLYVDDFCMCYRSKSMRTIERHLQQCINRIEDWALHNGFKFSKSKTQCVHFCQLRKVHDDPELNCMDLSFLLLMILHF